jgi:hypothetical protein
MSITISHYKLTLTQNELSDPFKFEDWEKENDGANQNLEKFATDIEEFELHNKTIQIFKNENDFNKYKSLFNSSEDFINTDYYRIIEDQTYSLDELIESYIFDEKLGLLEQREYNRGINGITVRMITFGKKVSKKGFYADIIGQQKIETSSSLKEKIKLNYLYSTKQTVDFAYSLMDQKSKENFKKTFIDEFEADKSLILFF